MTAVAHSRTVVPVNDQPVDLKSLPPTLDLVTAARLLGVGRTVAYKLVHEGQWPTPVVHVGRKIRVPTAPLLVLLGVAPIPP
jgi:excisionase family DNA binding protein